MTDLKKIEKLLGFRIPLHKKFTERFGRPILDFPKFAHRYRSLFPKQPDTEFYTEIADRHGEECVEVLLNLN